MMDAVVNAAGGSIDVESAVSVAIDTVSTSVSVASQDTATSVEIKHCHYEVVTHTPGHIYAWPFGSPSAKIVVDPGTVRVVDAISMPGMFRGMEWLFLVSVDSDDSPIAVQGHLSCFKKGNDVHYCVFALIGDVGSRIYDVDVNANGGMVELTFKNVHSRSIDVRVLRFGLFT